MSVEKSLGHRREVERVASWPRRQPRQVRSAQRVLRGRLAGSPRGDARARAARHGTRKRRLRRFEAASADLARCRWRRSSANCVGWITSRVDHADNRAKSAARSACVVVGWLVLHGATRARAARHETRKRRLRRFEASSADLARCRWRRASATGVGWSASRVGCADNRAKSTARSACVVGGWLVLHVTKRARARAARHGNTKRRLRRFEEAAADLARYLRQERRPTAWGGAYFELAVQTTAPSPQRAVRGPWAVGWFAT